MSERLKFPFVRSGFRHVLVERQGDACLVRREPVGRGPGDEAPPHFEVVVLRHVGARTLAGKALPAGEQYPSGSAWGELGWTYTSESEARTRMVRISRTSP